MKSSQQKTSRAAQNANKYFTFARTLMTGNYFLNGSEGVRCESRSLIFVDHLVVMSDLH